MSTALLQTYFSTFFLAFAFGLAADPSSHAGNSLVSRQIELDADRISESQLRKHLEYIASDELEGRDTPSPGLEKAAEYIASNLKKWGLEPSGDKGTYFQSVPMVTYNRDSQRTKAQLNGRNLVLGKDFTTPENPDLTGSASGRLVYVGHGWIVKDRNIDPYAHVDVKGKVVIIIGATPQGVSFSNLKGKEGKDWFLPPHAAKMNGAVGMIGVLIKDQLSRFPLPPQVEEWEPRVLLRENENPPERIFPLMLPSKGLLKELFGGERVDLTEIVAGYNNGNFPEPFALKDDKILSFSNTLNRVEFNSRNILGKITGSDPVLRKQFVVLGAHYDHIGIAPDLQYGFKKLTSDAIFHGADDDGSGTVGILELARSLQQGQRLKRSVLFAWHTGEEKGLLGSTYLVEHPPIPLEQMVAELQFDMIGRTRLQGDKNEDLVEPGQIGVEGAGVVSSDLELSFERVNGAHSNLKLRVTADAVKEPHHWFFRSDNAAYAAGNVPTLQFHDGEHVDRHLPSDTVDKIDYASMVKLLKTEYVLIAKLANSEGVPLRDKPATIEQRALLPKLRIAVDKH